MSDDDDDDATLYPPPLYTTAQANFLAVIPYFTAPWSVLGSSLILWSIWYDRRALLKHVYHRIVLGMSCVDLVSSLGMLVVGPWAVPSDWPYGRSGRGNVTTCEASGFLLQLSFGTMWYSVFLAVYFVMHLRWEWKERRIACCLELFAHFFSIFIITLFPSVGAVKSDVFNPRRDLPGWCWFADNPPLCSENNNNQVNNNDGNENEEEESTNTCIRGLEYKDFADLASTGNVMFAWVVIIICMILIVCKVRRLERNLQRYAIGGTGGHHHGSSSVGGGSSRGASRRGSGGGSAPNFARTKATARQALLYIVAFFVTYSPMVVILAMQDYPNNVAMERKRKLPVAMLVKFFFPLQGFFNAIVYFHRRFADLIKDGKSLSFLRRIPWIGPWIQKLSSRRTTARRNRNNNNSNNLGRNNNNNNNNNGIPENYCYGDGDDDGDENMGERHMMHGSRETPPTGTSTNSPSANTEEGLSVSAGGGGVGGDSSAAMSVKAKAVTTLIVGGDAWDPSHVPEDTTNSAETATVVHDDDDMVVVAGDTSDDTFKDEGDTTSTITVDTIKADTSMEEYGKQAKDDFL
ncbi:hypothetical protein ACA910_015736 [Epithemia clementina (nom. ined.)]